MEIKRKELDERRKILEEKKKFIETEHKKQLEEEQSILHSKQEIISKAKEVTRYYNLKFQKKSIHLNSEYNNKYLRYCSISFQLE